MSEGVLIAERLAPGGTITLIFGKPIVTQMSDPGNVSEGETPDTTPNSEEIYEEEEVPTEEDIIDEDDIEEEEDEVPTEDEGIIEEN